MNIPSVELNNGVKIPQLGFGTYEIHPGDETFEAVAAALRTGYRHIDTAKYYRNEKDVGKALRQSDIAREELFVTTKLWPTDFRDPLAAFERSFKELDLEYIDLYLIHWPVPGQPRSVWRTLEKLYEEKRVRAIGISNYGVGEMRTMLNARFGLGNVENILGYANVPPAVNQIQCNVFEFPNNVLAFCKKNGIVVEAYSPLTRGSQLHDRTVAAIAEKYRRTPAQIMLRWCIEHGTVPLPKTTHVERMKENMDVFDWSLKENDVAALDELS